MNLIVIMLDSFRQDHLGCYGNASMHTPSIDALAEESVVFERCWSESLPTIPARRAMHTCARTFPFPDEPRPKGIYNRHLGWRPIPEEQVTFAEHLRERGYITALIADTYHIFKPAMNFHRYFDCFEWIRGQEYDMWRSGPLKHYDLDHITHPDCPPSRSLVQYLQNQSKRKVEEDYQSPRVFASAIEWLQDNRDHEKFLLWVESFDPHEPWEAPQKYVDMYDAGYEGREFIDPRGIRKSDMTEAEYDHVRALYAAEATMVDAWVGRFLQTLREVGRMDDSVILLLSDHGKTLGEFDAFGMNELHTSRALHAVPMMIRHPQGAGAGTRVNEWAYNIDAMATLLHLIGEDPLPQNEGMLLPPASSESGLRDHLVTAYNAVHSVWRDEWLYTHNTRDGGEALYDLAHDPAQTEDVLRDHGEVREDLAGLLRKVVEG